MSNASFYPLEIPLRFSWWFFSLLHEDNSHFLCLTFPFQGHFHSAVGGVFKLNKSRNPPVILRFKTTIPDLMCVNKNYRGWILENSWDFPLIYLIISFLRIGRMGFWRCPWGGGGRNCSQPLRWTENIDFLRKPPWFCSDVTFTAAESVIYMQKVLFSNRSCRSLWNSVGFGANIHHAQGY